MIGSVRNAQDQQRVDDLKKHIENLKVTDSVEIVVNAAYPELLQYLETSLIGLHTMYNEHFGISIIEYMVQNT
ncbi:MAG: alpha,2-mannosyltransferase [Bacteroidota bacterium]|jgi:alpha-1,2-mannosyltransferase